MIHTNSAIEARALDLFAKYGIEGIHSCDTYKHIIYENIELYDWSVLTLCNFIETSMDTTKFPTVAGLRLMPGFDGMPFRSIDLGADVALSLNKYYMYVDDMASYYNIDESFIPLIQDTNVIIVTDIIETGTTLTNIEAKLAVYDANVLAIACIWNRLDYDTDYNIYTLTNKDLP